MRDVGSSPNFFSGPEETDTDQKHDIGALGLRERIHHNDSDHSALVTIGRGSSALVVAYH